MFVNSKVNGFFLLVVFGLLCGMIAGALFGLGMGFYWRAFHWNDEIGRAILVFSGIGAAFGSVPGMLYGLSSYYFNNKADWLLTGGLYGAIPGGVLIFSLGWHGLPFLLICMSHGLLVGVINLTFSNWWGMRLRAEGLELLRPKS